MAKFHPSAEELAEKGGVIGYPQPGRYILMVRDGEILGGEIERANEFRNQYHALHKYYPAEAKTVVAVLDETGEFTEQPYTGQ